MSTTASAEVALRYGGLSGGAQGSMLLFKLRTASFMERGASIQFISAFPEEEEVLVSRGPAASAQARAHARLWPRSLRR